MGLRNVLKRSVGKALRDVAITVGSASAVVALTVVADPEVLAPLVAALPSLGGSLLLLAVPILAKVGIDAIKHRNEG